MVIMTISPKSEKQDPGLSLASTPEAAKARALRRIPGFFAPLPNGGPSRPLSLIPHLTNAEILQKSLLHNPALRTEIQRSDWLPMLDSTLFAPSAGCKPGARCSEHVGNDMDC